MNAIVKLLTPLIVLSPLIAQSQCPNPLEIDTLITSALRYTPYTWEATGKQYTTSTTDTVISDCEMHVLNLTMYEKQIRSERVFACDSYFWNKTEQTYTNSGTYTHTETTDKGGIVEYQLTLTIDNTYHSSDQTSACDSMAWHELELPIGSGEGRAVSIDGSGTVVAVGNHRYGTDAVGQVSVYQWSTSGWTQLGPTLEGEDGPSGNFGYAVSLSTNGKYLAVGSPRVGAPGSTRVYRWNGSRWEQRGSTIYGIARFDELGSALDLNNDGSVLAVGAASSNRVAFELGEVRVYQWNGTDWAQMGNHLYEYPHESIPDNNGTSVALSGDGTRVIFGAPFAKHVNGFFTYNGGGRYMIYDWNGSEWVQFRSFQGYRTDMNVGRSVSINEAGDIYGAGADIDRKHSGMVFSNRGLLGELHSKTEGERYGKSISFNQEGDIIAISSPNNDETGLAAGMVQVYKWSGEAWKQIGQNLYGEVSAEQFGFDLQLNGDGRVLVVGSNKGEYDDSPAEGTHVYYYGCANPEQNCTTSPCQQTLETTLNVSECEYYKFNGVFLYESGQYQETFTSANGCDSLVTLNLTIESKENYVLEATACNSYEFNGETLTSSGEYTATFASAGGCDSLVTLRLTIGPDATTQVVQTCGAYVFAGKTLTSSGTYHSSFVNRHGCDSLVTLDLTLSESINSTFSIVACESYEFFSTTLTESGTYTETIPSTAGCDSIVTLNLTVLEPDDESCQGMVTELEDGLETAVSVYPNPAGRQLTIDLGATYQRVQIRLTTLSGQVVVNERYWHTDQIHTHLNVPIGFYLLHVVADEHPPLIYKIQKQ